MGIDLTKPFFLTIKSGILHFVVYTSFENLTQRRKGAKKVKRYVFVDFSSANAVNTNS